MSASVAPLKTVVKLPQIIPQFPLEQANLVGIHAWSSGKKVPQFRRTQEYHQYQLAL
jgi:Ni/Co efflux regulator RcnB